MIYNGKPVWSAKHGWLLVNYIHQHFLFSDGNTIPFANTGQLLIVPPLYAEAKYPQGKPLFRQELGEHLELWVELISPDIELRNDRKGIYTVEDSFC